MGRNKILKDKSQIIDVALNLIETEGLEAFSMRRLSKEMGVSSMTLYNYVQNADDVLREILFKSFSTLYEKIYSLMNSLMQEGYSGICAYAKAYALVLYEFSESHKAICCYLIGDGYTAFHNNAELRPLYDPFNQFLLNTAETGENQSLQDALQIYECCILFLIHKHTSGIHRFSKEEFTRLVDAAIERLIRDSC